MSKEISSQTSLSGLRTTDTFWKLIDGYNQDPKLIIQQGGTSSGKTFATLQLLYLIAKESPKRKIISVVSYALPHLRTGAIRDFEEILESTGVVVEDIRNKTDNQYFIGKSIVEFFGAENTAKVHGPRRDILYINEAIDYNPKREFWVHEEVIPNEKHTFIKTTYLNNNLLDPTIVQQIESRRHNDYFWRVYGLGEIGAAEGAVFTNWRVGDFDESLPSLIGLDFGFHPDPDACSQNAIDLKHRKIYVRELFHENNQSFYQLRERLSQVANSRQLIIADSAEKRLINDLRADFNIKGISKKGSVVEWIRKMQDYEIIITEDSPNVERELRNYQWHDKKAGVPVDAFNHFIDEIRYCLMEMETARRGIRRTN